MFDFPDSRTSRQIFPNYFLLLSRAEKCYHNSTFLLCNLFTYAYH